MEEQVKFWRLSLIEYSDILCLALVANVVLLVATLPIFVMVSLTGWQMFFIWLHNLINNTEVSDVK